MQGLYLDINARSALFGRNNMGVVHSSAPFMNRSKSFTTYRTISDLLIASKSGRDPSFQNFDMFSFREISNKAKNMMPPHRRGFYSIIFLKDQKSGQVNVNQERHTSLRDIILFQGLEHVFSFVRDSDAEGIILLFDNSLLIPYEENPEVSFPFFGVLNQNLFHLNTSEKQAFEQLFQLIEGEQTNLAVIKPLVIALLEKSKKLFVTYTREEQFLSKKMRTVRKYINLINNHFLDHKEVTFYADQLNVTSNYLNEIVKTETGSSAKRHISERLLLEAQNLLAYSELSISEISHLLHFSEPTHFTKFFKKETGVTPKAYQNQQP